MESILESRVTALEYVGTLDRTRIGYLKRTVVTSLEDEMQIDTVVGGRLRRGRGARADPKRLSTQYCSTTELRRNYAGGASRTQGALSQSLSRKRIQTRRAEGGK